MTEKEQHRIEEHYSDYKYAADKVGVPVLALPAIHYRESQLFNGLYSYKRKRIIKCAGGPFMLDFGPRDNGAEFNDRIRKYEKKIYKLYYGEGVAPRVRNDFRFAALLAAHHLKEKLRCEEWSFPCLEDAMWGYNGRASWCKQSESPYLWSDPKAGKSLIVRYKLPDGTIVKYKDGRPGVMVIYHELYKTMKGGKFK